MKPHWIILGNSGALSKQDTKCLYFYGIIEVTQCTAIHILQYAIHLTWLSKKQNKNMVKTFVMGHLWNTNAYKVVA